MISVIIPTYNNKHILYAHLEKYEKFGENLGKATATVVKEINNNL